MQIKKLQIKFGLRFVHCLQHYLFLCLLVLPEDGFAADHFSNHLMHFSEMMITLLK